ncbi:permease [Microtetraspora sp. NBRC 13810]|nr:permease [Microtetraspora sp. NBRC 13810]
MTTLSGISQHFGAALAFSSFSVVGPTAMAWLRLLVAAVFMGVWRRPSFRLGRTRLAVAVGYGSVTAGMNISVYQAIERIPLGTVTAIEFCGPVVVGALLSRSLRDWAAVVLAAAGVLVITGGMWAQEVIGVLFAAGAAVLYAIKIVLTDRIARSPRSLDDLSVAFAVLTIALAPVMFPHTLRAWTSGTTLLAIVTVGILSTVVPYLIDQYTVRIAGPGGLAVLLALLPGTATLVGALALGQVPTLREVVGVALIMAAVGSRTTRL